MDHPVIRGMMTLCLGFQAQHWQFGTSVAHAFGINAMFQIYFSLSFCGYKFTLFAGLGSNDFIT